MCGQAKVFISSFVLCCTDWWAAPDPATAASLIGVTFQFYDDNKKFYDHIGHPV